uniref:Ubiquilin 1 n=1 Tax=Poecilia formosa TaxID=48698 RepID=A0A096MEQ9_POEFO
MSDSVKDKHVNPETPLRSDRTHVVLRSASEGRTFTVRGNCTVTQLKRCLSERLRVPAEQLVLLLSGRVLREAELMSHLTEQKGSISLCVIRRKYIMDDKFVAILQNKTITSVLKTSIRPEPSSARTSSDPVSEPVGLVSAEGLDSLGSENSRSSFLTALWSQMESELPSDPELMHRVLASPLVQNALCTSSPPLTGQRSPSNPQIQQLLTTNPEVEDMLNNPDAIEQPLGLIREPEMTEEVIQKEDGALENVPMVQDNPANTALHVFQTNDAKMQQQDIKQTQKTMFPLLTTSCESHQGPGGRTSPTSPPSPDSTDSLRELTASPITGSLNAGKKMCMNPVNLCIKYILWLLPSGLQSLLQEITASPGLTEILLSGPHINCVLNCLSQNPDFAAQMQNGELLSMMLNPRAMEALLQIQQGLQTLAADTPSLMTVAGPGTSAGSAQHPSDPSLNNQTGCRPQDAPLTEQQLQEQFVHQMLKALANTNDGVRHEEEEDFQEELQQMNSMGFRDRKANLQALISSGGDLSSALHLLLTSEEPD